MNTTNNSAPPESHAERVVASVGAERRAGPPQARQAPLGLMAASPGLPAQGGTASALPEGVQRVVAALQAQGHVHMPRMLDDAARTAQDRLQSIRLGKQIR